jgi:hypothetical protein
MWRVTKESSYFANSKISKAWRYGNLMDFYEIRKTLIFMSVCSGASVTEGKTQLGVQLKL